MKAEFDTIREHIPDICHTILDIGCGIAGIDTFIYSHLKNKKEATIYLLDKSSTEQAVWYGFKQSGAFYNSLQLAKNVLELNGIDPAQIRLNEVGHSEDWRSVKNFDLVISLISWGFHYPVDTYLDAAHDCLRPGGVLILDIRNGSDGRKAIDEKFGASEVILDSSKFIRVKAVKS